MNELNELQSLHSKLDKLQKVSDQKDNEIIEMVGNKKEFLGLKLSAKDKETLKRIANGKTLSYTIRQMIREKGLTISRLDIAIDRRNGQMIREKGLTISRLDISM